jgi:hypothetical protein
MSEVNDLREMLKSKGRGASRWDTDKLKALVGDKESQDILTCEEILGTYKGEFKHGIDTKRGRSVLVLNAERAVKKALKANGSEDPFVKPVYGEEKLKALQDHGFDVALEEPVIYIEK